MQRPIPLPTNRHIRAQRDRQWPLAFALLALLSATLTLALALIGWPRLQSISIHYDLVELRGEVEILEYRALDLEAHLHALRAPEVLAEQAERSGLVPPAVANAARLSAGAQR